MAQITVEELRSLLFRVDNQKITIEDFRKILFDYPDQKAVIINNAMTIVVINTDGTKGLINTD